MSLQSTTKELKDLLCNLSHDLEKADGGNKAASQRVRTGTVKLEKVAKRYRKESISTEKKVKGTKKPVKKAAPSKAAAKPRPAAAAKAKSAKTAAKSTKTKKTAVKARPLSIRRPSAKLPTRRASF